MTFTWQSAGAMLAVVSISYSTALAAPQTTTPKKGHINNKTIQFPLRGDEYINSPNYPKDNVGEGFEKNAKADYRSKCATLKNRLRNDNTSIIVSVRCAEARNVSLQANRRQYQGIVTLKINHRHIYFEKGDRIESPLVKADDFSNVKYKWQESRTRARKAYKKACEDYTDRLIQNEPLHILLVDCGIVRKDSSKHGWRYFSTATVYKMSQESGQKACGKNIFHNDTGWDIAVSGPIRDDIGCRFGGRKEKLYERVIQYRCQNGSKVFTGKQKYGSYIGTVGSCLSPANCASNKHNSSWWEQDGHIRESVQCKYGGDKVDVYKKLRKYSCYNGSISKTNSTKKGLHIRTEGQCNEQVHEKRSCSGHAHGDFWQERNVTHRDSKSCGRGGTKVVTKIQKIRYRCNDGNIIEESRVTEIDETDCRHQQRVDGDREKREREKAEQERHQRERERAERERQQRERQAEREHREREKAKRERHQRERERAERERQQRERQAERERREREKAKQDRRQRERERAERERQKAERDRQLRNRKRAEREREQREQEAERKQKKAERERQ